MRVKSEHLTIQEYENKFVIRVDGNDVGGWLDPGSNKEKHRYVIVNQKRCALKFDSKEEAEGFCEYWCNDNENPIPPRALI